MKMNLIFIFCCINLLICVSNEEIKSNSAIKSKSKEDVFIPTYEWQVVKKGQPIPKGLHVRINLETGLTEAKLLEQELNENDKNNALLEVDQPEQQEEVVQDNLKISKQFLTDALKNIRNEDVPSSDDLLRVTKKFKNYEQLKKELGNLNMSIKTDAEVLRDLFSKYKQYNSDKHLDINIKNVQIYNTLEDIDYLVHQIDNADEFVNLKGFTKIIYINLNSTNTKIKCQVLNILGSCTQNNPKVQIHALETGSIDKLLRTLALENDNEVLSRGIYAISSLLRRFPLAQTQFIKNGGLSVFLKIFEKPDKLKLQVRIVTLIYDLLTEYEQAMGEANSLDHIEKKRQYIVVGLKNKLKELEWCKIFSNVLIHTIALENNNHDAIEKCLSMMLLVSDMCNYNSIDLKRKLIDLNKTYKRLSEEEHRENLEDDDVTNHHYYFQSLKELTDSLFKKLTVQSKTEL